jgi:hypothetical protein
MRESVKRGLMIAAQAVLIGAVRQSPAAEIDRLFPDLDGWRLTVDSTVYTPSNLWDLIDGAAETFLSYGFKNLRVAEYINDDSVDVRVELYRHSSSTNAFGIYATERKPDYHFISIGTQGYFDSGILNFLAGEYYAKLSSHRSGAKTQVALEKVARAVDLHLGQPRGWPAGLGSLPVEGRIPNTESYIAENFLGYSSLKSAFTAQYGEKEGFQIFVIETAGTDQANAIVQKLVSAAPGKQTAPGVFRLSDPNSGVIVVVQRGRLVSGIVNPPGTREEERYVALLTK